MELYMHFWSVKPSLDKQHIRAKLMGEEISWDLTFYMNNRLSKLESEYHIQLKSVLNPAKTISYDMITDEFSPYNTKTFGPFPLNKLYDVTMPACRDFTLRIKLDAGEGPEQSKIQESRVSTKCLEMLKEHLMRL
jgi:hypothetical protein